MSTLPPPPYALLETLYESEGTRVYRGVRSADRRPVILKVLDPQRSRPRKLSRLKKEYELGKSLDTWAVVRPLALESYQGMPALVMENFCGHSLDRLLGTPMGIEQFLSLAVRLVSAVAELHQREIIHKDLRPQNILVDPTSGEVKLIDFGFATRLPREHEAPHPPSHIEGSLPYLSPEQTGRTNREVDSRSDLYTVGIIFYQMLSGHLPFEARDPVEWVYCHVARTPPALPGSVPEVLSRIVMKLLAKVPEERYQSARGLRHDLERCLDKWRAGRQLTPFPLCERDVSGRFQLPQRLYGREEELTQLFRAFERVVSTGTPEFLLVSGYSGTGKSSLVRELQPPIVQQRGFFHSGRFDQNTRHVPYSAVVQALTALVLDIMAEDEERLRTWKQALRDALGLNAQLVLGIVPKLRLLLGEQPLLPELPPLEAEQRLRRAFQDFLGVLARREHPLVLFFDNLQWVDAASLKLIEDLLAARETRYLLLIGAYRDNEVPPAHPLRLVLNRLRQTPAIVRDVPLSPIRLEHLTQLVADTVHTEPESARPLATLVHEKTGSNPFFALQFLTTLYQERLLSFDEERLAWRWDIAAIKAKGYTDNVIDFMVRRLTGLPGKTREALATAACIGNKGRLSLLAQAHGSSEEDLLGDLWSALREGLLFRARDTYVFAHERVQQAAYSLLPPGRRAEVHLAIGRLLLAHTPPKELEQRVFDIVTQLNLGSDLLTDEPERLRLAELNLLACRRAKASTAYSSALSYGTAGVSLLGSSAWDERYELTFALYLEQAECTSLNGDFPEADRLATLLLPHARTKLDKAAVYRVKVVALVPSGSFARALDAGLESLRLFGLDLPRHPAREEVRARYLEVMDRLGDRPLDELMDLPPLADPERLTVMQTLQTLGVSAYSTDPHLYALLEFHIVDLSLRYGNADASASGYARFGLILATVFHRYEDGYQFAKLSVRLVEQHGFLSDRPTAYSVLYLLSFWVRPMDQALSHAEAALRAAAELRSVTYLCQVCIFLLTHKLARGEVLAEVQLESEQWLRHAESARCHDMIGPIISLQRFVQNMRGRTQGFSTFSDAAFRQDVFESGLASQTPITGFWYHVYKLMARYLSGDYEEALAAGAKARELLKVAPGFPQTHDFHVFHSLTLAVCAGAGRCLREEALATVREHQAQLREWAEVNPGTFLHTHALVSAELARLQGDHEEAMRLYEQSIRAARDQGFVQHQGLAYELASRYYRSRGFELFADTYLREARTCYARWGADGKVKHLEELHPHLRDETCAAASPTTFAARSEQLDLLSVVKASQTISRELVLEKLIRTLLRIVLEQGGARRGFLFLMRSGALSLEAEASLSESGPVIELLPSVAAAAAPRLLPLSIVQYVARSKERVVLDNSAVATDRLSRDEYLAREKPRAVLCLPILRQDEVVGVLYLENNLLGGSFPPERLGALEVLAAQAAISLENAMLLEQERRSRAEAEEAERRAAFLAEVGTLLSESLDYETTLGKVAKMAVPFLADWCVVDVVEEGDVVRRIASVHTDPAKEELLREVEARYPAIKGSPQPASRAMASGGSILIPELTEAAFKKYARDAGNVQLARALGARSSMAVPMKARGWMLGAMTFVSTAPGRHYGSKDLAFAEELTHRAAMAIDNARLYRRAQEAIRLREEFLSVASHELHTPVTSLQLLLQGLGSGLVAPSPETLSKTIGVARRQTARLTKLVDELLDVSRLQGDLLSLKREELDLAAVARSCVERLAEDFKRAGCQVSLRAEAPVLGRWNRLRLEQVVLHLLGNATKFGAGRPIEVTVDKATDRARLRVTDRGIGIAPERLPRIFGRFERAVSVKQYGGLGLGLYFVREILQALGGTVRVESVLGSGSTFTIELPCTDLSSSADGAPQEGNP